ncbi:MAG: hypothetical protein J6S01_08180 [Bacteroidales bacterium]|nr:hypothetical protein [Bacteroidales bacterium]
MRVSLPQKTLRGTLALTMVLFAYRYESQSASEAPERPFFSHNGRIKLPL